MYFHVNFTINKNVCDNLHCLLNDCTTNAIENIYSIMNIFQMKYPSWWGKRGKGEHGWEKGGRGLGNRRDGEGGGEQNIGYVGEKQM